MDDLRNQLSNLIENNKIDQAIKLLKEESARRGGKLDHIIISLSSRYKRYKEKSLMGLEAREQEFTKIVSDALELVKVLDDPSAVVMSESAPSSEIRKEASYSKPQASSSSSSSKFIQMGIGGLAVIGLITLIAIFAGGDDSGQDTSLNSFDDTSVQGQGDFVAPDVYGDWIQIAQTLGPENDCADCMINIAQDGGAISIASNEEWNANLNYNGQEGIFQGLLNWGIHHPDEPEQGVELYWDENDNIVIATVFQGYSFTMTYAPR